MMRTFFPLFLLVFSLTAFAQTPIKENLPRAEFSILPKDRAKDLVEAFTQLSKNNPAKHADLILKTKTIKGIVQLKMLTNGTAFIVQSTTQRGMQEHVVFIEDIVGIVVP